ncbi:MAG: DUF2752 domain-containing protein [Deltaproteobacteria bacterium]|nr:DUF2752 domain-containing protein [Deltaproteobacteria bacterium]
MIPLAAPSPAPLRRLGLAEVYLGIGLLAVLVARFFPFEAMGTLYRCPSLVLFDLPCLTCGFTRSWIRLAHLEVGSAFAVSPLGATIFLLLCGLLLFGVLRLALGLRWPRFSLSRRATLGLKLSLVTVILANWAYLVFSHRVLGTWQ